MQDMGVKTGGCQCGRVRYRAECDSVGEASLCHCRMCQRATGGFAAALVAFPRGAVQWEREPEYYASSPIARRPFCRECGTPLGFCFNEGAEIELTLGSFDDPSGFVPAGHAGAESLLEPWVNSAHLPRKRSDQAASVVAAWAAKGLGVPK